MNTKPIDPTLNLYNPAALSPEQLLAEFIDRKGLLERILDIIRHNVPDQPQQHLVIIGPRGMGKTTLLCAIKHKLDRDETLTANWLPILFQEEQYGIGDLADFWLETIRHLESVLERPAQAAEQLLDENPANLAGRAQERFFQLLAETGKRALLLVDNLNDIFRAIDDGQALHSLRALWMTDPRIMVIGAAPSYFEEITEVDQAFHDFFRSFSLDRLNQEELESLLRRFAEMLGDDAVINVIEQAPERVAALRILTGGNPRLVKLGYRVLRDGLNGDVRQDLERLLDESTPFFKHRIDSLAKETRRAFDAIARRWDPVTVDDIRRELRKPSNYVSAQIKRLIDEGFVEEAGGDKKKRYQVSERFYNVYYLMRHSREGRNQLRWLVGFMQTFYSRKDFKEWASRLEGELAGPMSEPVRSEKLAYLHALSAAADDDGRGAAFDALVRDAIARDDRRAIDEEIAEGDPVESHGSRYLLAETVWLLEPNKRCKLGFRPDNNKWWQTLRITLGETGLQQAQSCLTALGAWVMDTPRHARAAGVMLDRLFLRHMEAETAFRKALEFDPQYPSAWNNLGNVLMEQSRNAEAEAAYSRGLEFDQQQVAAWHNLGIALYRQNRHDEAESAYRKALEIDPQDASTWCALGDALYAQNRHAEAEAALRKVLEIDPQNFTARINLGTLMSGQSRLSDAEVFYKSAMEIEPQNIFAWFNLGNVFLAQNRYAEAEIAYKKSLEIDQQFVPAWLNLSGVLCTLKRPTEAEAACRKALELYPQDVIGWVNLSNTLFEQRRYDEAETAYRKTLYIDPEFGVAHINLGCMLIIAMGRIEEGINELILGLALKPNVRHGLWILTQHWQAVLPAATAYIIAQATNDKTQAENLRSTMTDVLLLQSAKGQKNEVREALLALDETGQQIFEPLLLALQAMDDRSLLYRIAREKRELVLDVMKRIEGEE
ncbi:MAG: tetratricopeptide repeat protein [Proteobacteria bacterium]|nr:tetratricopeptide repeat protein [Pseudomonadota bacterium]